MCAPCLRENLVSETNLIDIGVMAVGDGWIGTLANLNYGHTFHKIATGLTFGYLGKTGNSAYRHL